MRVEKLFPFLTKVFADSASPGSCVATALLAIAFWRIAIVKRADAAGFTVLNNRWMSSEPSAISGSLPSGPSPRTDKDLFVNPNFPTGH